MVEVPEDIAVDDLAFPHARIVEMVKSQRSEGQLVRKNVYYGLNILLERIAKQVIDDMMKTDKAYVELTDLNRAADQFENVDAILKEKRRVIQHLNALREDVDKLSRDLERADRSGSEAAASTEEESSL